MTSNEFLLNQEAARRLAQQQRYISLKIYIPPHICNGELVEMKDVTPKKENEIDKVIPNEKI